MTNIIAQYGNGRFHPDFGQDYQLASNPLYGIPYNVVHGNSTAKIQVVIDAYPDQSDFQNAPIPANAAIEGDTQNGPTVGVDNRGDSHLLVWDEPSGSGTVDVLVQSGLTSANASANYTSPIWGYGLSVTSSVARFTYQSLDPFHDWLVSAHQ